MPWHLHPGVDRQCAGPRACWLDAMCSGVCSGVDWRQKLENQRGAVLATELKNNANKLAKWTAGALVQLLLPLVTWQPD